MAKKPNNVNEASAQVAAMPTSREVKLAAGKTAVVHRLSWIQFEALWLELASIIAAVMGSGDELDSEQLAAELAQAPAFVLKLTALSTSLPEPELASWNFDDVLAVCAAAIELNFNEPKGVRDFFCAAAKLAGQELAATAQP